MTRESIARFFAAVAVIGLLTVLAVAAVFIVQAAGESAGDPRVSGRSATGTPTPEEREPTRGPPYFVVEALSPWLAMTPTVPPPTPTATLVPPTPLPQLPTPTFVPEPPRPAGECPPVILEVFGDTYAPAACKVSFCESRWDAGAVGGQGERGYFQIHPIHPDSSHDPLINTLAAYRISSGGTNWSAWAAVCRP